MRFKSAVEFLKPVAIGAGLLGGITLVRVIGASIVGYPLRSAGQAASAVGLAALGGAAAGLIYAVIGRPLRAHGAAGNYAAGIVTVAPYLVVISVYWAGTTRRTRSVSTSPPAGSCSG